MGERILCVYSRNVNEETIREYIKGQEEDDKLEDSRQ